MAWVRDLVRRPIDKVTLRQLQRCDRVYLHGNPMLYERVLTQSGIKFETWQQEELGPNEALLLCPDSHPLLELVALTDRLLGPEGCPWDQQQTHETLRRHLLEETYEVLQAIDRGTPADLCEELGDLLLQPILHAQIAAKSGDFDIAHVASSIVEKLIRRHPHVFGDVHVGNADEVLRNWDRIKAREKGPARHSLLDGIPTALPSLLRAFEVSKRAARAGFEWPNIDAVYEKLREEELELQEAVEAGDTNQIEAELGDLLFTWVNIARWMNLDPENALRRMVDRFTERFQKMESLANCPLDELDPKQWDELWITAKQRMLPSGSDCF